MFSTIIEKILLQFLGEYIDGIKDSMDVALLKGKIKIENVSLKKDFFNNLSFPVRLAFSLIESINIHIPWSNLKQKPTTVEVDGVYALFFVNYELEEYQFDPEKRLNEMIDKATQLIKMKLEEKQRDSDSIVEKYILRIVDNLKVTVKNIHLRMQSMQRKWDFSMGLMLENIEVYTISEKGDRHFFVRSKRHGHITLHHRKEKHHKDDELFKKVIVNNVRLYFTQYETNFMTLLEGGQHKMKEMKAMLQSDREMLLGQQRAKNQPNIVLRINLQGIIKATLNEMSNKYDIDVRANLCPLTLNLTDRMTANIFYFSQFAFEWQMRKYKRPNNLAATSPQMINFYKLMLYNILSETPIHKSDYKNLLRVVSEWQYDFLNKMTIQFVQEQKVKKQLSRRKNRKKSEDVVMLEQFKKEIEERILTEDEKKEIFDIIGRIGIQVAVPLIEVTLTKSMDECNIFAQRQQQILKIGCAGVSLKYSTLWQKQQFFTLKIDDLVYFSENELTQKKISQQSLHQILLQLPFLTVVYTKQEEQKVESMSIKIQKRLIRVKQRLMLKLIEWTGCIKLRPSTVNYLKEILVHYTTEIVKVLLEKLFKEFRVVDLNIGLPTVEIVMNGNDNELFDERRKQDTLRMNFGKFQGKFIQQGMYHFQFTQDTNLTINNKIVTSISSGTTIQILDKKPINQQQTTIYQIEDRQKIMLKISDFTIHHIDKLIDFTCTLIQSPILQQFLKMKIIDDQSILLEGVFYLNNNPRRQRIVMRSDSLYFLPSKYRISLKLCKVYKMKVEMKNYLVFHEFVSNIADVVEVENQLAMDTIFYKIREQIHQLSTTSQWDAFYKADYPVSIQRLDMLKSHHGENEPLFNFECFIGQVKLPLEGYLHKFSEDIEQNQSIETKLLGKNALQVLQFFESQRQSDQQIYGRKTSMIEISQIYVKLCCYQLTIDVFADVKQIRLVIEDQVIFNRFGLSLSMIKAETLIMNFIVNQLGLFIHDKESLRCLIEIGGYFTEKVQKMIDTANQCDLWNRIEKTLQQNENLQISALSSNSFMGQDVSRMSSYEPKGTFKMQHSMLLALRMTIKLNSFKMNLLNYITQMKNVQNEIEIYRSESVPLIKIKAQDIIILSALQFNNLELRIQKSHNITTLSSIDCCFNAQKIRAFVNLELLLLDLTQGEIGELLCYVMDNLGRRRRKENEDLKSTTEKEETHVKFDDFVSPIKSIPSTIKKPSFQSMKSIHEEMMLEKQIRTINLQVNIKGVESEIIMTKSQDTIKFSVEQIILKRNTFSIGNIKATQNEQAIMSCQLIVISLPQYKDVTTMENLGQNILIQNFTDIESPRKCLGRQPLIQKHESMKQRQIVNDNTCVAIDGLAINLYINLIGEITSFVKQSIVLLRQSTQFNHLRKGISGILLKTLQKRQQISNVIEASKNKLTQNIQKSYQSLIQFKWSIDFENIFENISIQTNQPIIVSIFSHDQIQLLSSEINAKIDFPNFIGSSLVLQVNHFNKILQVFQPVLERTEIKIEKLKEQIQINLMESLKIVLSEQFLVNSLEQAEYISLKVNKGGAKRMLLESKNGPQELNIKKKKLYQKYKSTILVKQTSQDLQEMQRKPIQSQFSLQQNFLSNRQLHLNGNSSKMQVKNYTGCRVVCELSQESLPIQKIQVVDSRQQLTQNLQEQYFVIPFDMKETRFTSSVDFIDRQRPMKLKVKLDSQMILFTAQPQFEMEILFGQICRVGVKSEFFELSYRQNMKGQQYLQGVRSTMIEVVINFNKQRQSFSMEIRPLIQVINCTVLDLGLWSQNVSKQPTVLAKNNSKYLPFWVNFTLGINLPHYKSSQHQQSPQKMYKFPLISQQNFQENYPKQHTLILKQSFVHYFAVILGTQKCWIPLAFVKIKKYEKYFNKKESKWDFRETKCRLLVLPFIKVENHLEKSLWINGEVHLGRSERKLQNSEGQKVQLSNHQKQQAIYFFLISQVDKSISHLMLSFSQNGYNYHIPLPETLYLPKLLTFPTQGESLAPIAFNFLSTKNNYDQVVLHIYPLVQMKMKLPLKDMSLRVTARVDEKGKEKDCQELIIKQGKQIKSSENDKRKLMVGKQEICYLISEQYKLIKLQLSIGSDLQLQPQGTFFTSAMPDKRSLSFINLFGDQFKASYSLSQDSKHQSQSNGSSQSIKSSGSSSSSHSHSQSSQQSISSIFSQQSQYGTTQRIATRQLFIPTITQEGEMLFCHCLIKRTEKKLFMQEQLPNVCTIDVIDELSRNDEEKKKCEKYFIFEIICLNQSQFSNRNKDNAGNRTDLIEQELISQIKEVPKLKEIEQKLTKKLSSKLINIYVNNLNLSLIVNKAPSSSYYQSDIFGSSQFNTSQRFELMNITLGEIRASLSFTIENVANSIYQIQVQQQIGKLMINSINCQQHFNDSIMKLNEHKAINLLLGFSMGAIFLLDYDEKQIPKKQQQQDQNLSLCPSFILNKMLLKIVDLHQKSKQQKPNDHHFNVKITDHFILQMFNWIIKMYPIISAVVTPNTHQSLLEIILQSDTFNQFLQQFDGLMLCEEVKLKLSFISVSKKNSSLNIKKSKKINKEVESKKAQNFIAYILQQNNLQQMASSQVEIAIKQSKTMQRILKYIKKIPFLILQVENSHISIPQIVINGKLEKETLEKFERQVMINFATGIIKGMKLLGSPSSFMDYFEKNKNKKKRQKLSSLLNKLAKGSIISFTGILKSFSNGISQLTFDDKFLQERQETMQGSTTTEKSSKSKQGLKSLFLGFKSGFTGLVQQPVQNYKEDGAQGLIKGSLKGVTGLFTKPLTGILDLGTKALQNVGKQNKDTLNQRLNLLELQKTTYCRPLFHECSLIRSFTQTQYLAFVVLKGFFENDKNFGQISAFELKQNPFSENQKHVEKQNMALKLLDPIRYLLSICYDKTYFIQIGNQKDHRIVYNQIDHRCIKMIGRYQNSVCLVVQNTNIGNNQDQAETLSRSQGNEIFLNPLYLDEKQDIFRIYKKLTKK